jgi:hypothetical protein
MQIDGMGGQLRVFARGADGETGRQVEQNRQSDGDGGNGTPTEFVSQAREERPERTIVRSDTAALTGKNIDISI